MWLHQDTKKTLTLKRLLANPSEQQHANPEQLRDACLVTMGVYEQQFEWLLALEQLASEKDQVTDRKSVV